MRYEVRLLGIRSASFGLFNAEGQIVIVSGSGDQTLRRWNAATGEQIGQPLRLPSEPASLIFSALRSLLVAQLILPENVCLTLILH